MKKNLISFILGGLMFGSLGILYAAVNLTEKTDGQSVSGEEWTALVNATKPCTSEGDGICFNKSQPTTWECASGYEWDIDECKVPPTPQGPVSTFLLHSDTTNGSTTFVDSAGGKTVNPINGTIHSTNLPKFGSSSIYYDGVNDYITVSDSEDLAFNDGDFTVDMWFKSPDCDAGTLQGRSPQFFSRGDGNNTSNRLSFACITDGKVLLRTGSGANIETTGGFDDNQWHHLVLTREGSMVYIYVDGILRGSDTDTTNYTVSSIPMRIGVGYYNQYLGSWRGYLDEIRIIKGTAARSADGCVLNGANCFDVPTEAYTQ